MPSVPVAIDPAAAVPDLKGKDSGYALRARPLIQLQHCPTQRGKDSGYGDRAGGHRSSCSSARPKGGRIPAMPSVPGH
ncbi:hypothetical protein BV363_02996 [Pseudomonas syringae pv. actinidiae]|uniref:Uncharacterized protein n=1 Tax=Pseudomonas syringae pv. actinidiae TaxID=103796 RepID=A0A2P0QEZ9_PSESF|nr:hypothetical protein [Pseudomonas syringae pv. actinidiae]OSO51441.1 hypothetical protein BV363_02996 [Pseudomonas syringae pv. actinidiae]